MIKYFRFLFLSAVVCIRHYRFSISQDMKSEVVGGLQSCLQIHNCRQTKTANTVCMCKSWLLDVCKDIS